jgi:hypothetical protein
MGWLQSLRPVFRRTRWRYVSETPGVRFWIEVLAFVVVCTGDFLIVIAASPAMVAASAGVAFASDWMYEWIWLMVGVP